MILLQQEMLIGRLVN